MNNKEQQELQFLKLAKLYLILCGYGSAKEISDFLNKYDFRMKTANLSPSRCSALLKQRKRYSFMNSILEVQGNNHIIYYHKDFEPILKRELIL